VASNLYDEALEQLAPVPEAAPAAKPRTLYDDAHDLLVDRQAAQDTTLRQTARASSDLTPDAAAEARRLALRYGIPSALIARKLPHYQAQAQADDVAAAGRDHPTLGAWLADDPANVAIAKDDLGPLTAMDHTLRIGRNLAGIAPAGIASLGQSLWGAIQAGAELSLQAQQDYAAFDRRAPEITTLTAPEETAFQQWAATNQITDVDHPDSHYDYRGYFKATGGTPMQFGVDHFPDTFKQHGHPTFSVESQYSKGALDGGRWEGETFVAPVPGAFARVAAFATASAAVAEHLAERSRGPRPGAGFVEQSIYSGLESFVQQAPGVALSLATGGGSTVLLGLAGLTTGGQAYAQARAEGVPVNKAAAFAAFQGAVEVATEFIPAHKLLGDLAAKAPFVKLLAHQIASEIPGEEVATVLQDLGEWFALPSNKEKTFQDYLDARPSAAAATAISTLVAIGAQTISTHAAVRFVEKLGTDAAESKTIPRSPEAIEALIASATKGGAETLYAPLEHWNEYWQSKGVDPATKAAELTGSPEAYAFATQSGGDLPIPTARYVTQIAPTEHNAAFVNELRLDPEAMNGRELEALTKQLAAEPLATADAPAVSALRTAVESRLVAAGVPASQASAYAELADVVSNLSERTGIDLQARHNYGLDVVRPDLAVLQERPPDATQTPSEAPSAAPEASSPALAETPLPADTQPAGEAITASGDVQANPVSATFLGHGPSGPLYNIVGGPSDRSTVSAGELAAQGIAIPETPDEAAQLNGEQLRAQAMETRAAARLDTAAATAESEGPDGAESETRSGAGGEGRPARNRIAPSFPRERERPAQRARREAEHVEGLFTHFHDAAQTLDPTVDPVDLRAEFDFRFAAWQDLNESYQDSGHDPLDLLRAIADNGGLNEESSSGWRGELADLKSGLKFGAVAGVGKVFRAATAKDGAGRPITGLPFDVMQQRLQQDPRFAWIENVNILFDQLDEIIRNPPNLRGLPGTDELRADVRMDERVAWWRDSWRPVDFDVTEFHQGPKDETAPGEAQPVLPGTEGVREQEIATPEFALPFALTSEKGTPTKHASKVGALFDELFQALYHGSPHDFDRFSSEKIGTGEGAQAFGHGLYFAENQDVAGGYQRDLARAGALTINGKPWQQARLTKTQREMLTAVEANNLRLNDRDIQQSLGDAYRESHATDKQWQTWTKDWNALAGRLEQAESKGFLYQVDIPDEHIATMLDWDAPLSEQSETIQRALIPLVQRSIDEEFTTLKDVSQATGKSAYAALRDQAVGWQTGSNVPVEQERAAASAALQALGIPGIRYLDQGSRQAGDGSHNVVVFDDSIVTVTHKDGTAVTATERKEFLQTAVAAPPTGAPDRRGSIRFGADHQFTISLLEKADPSTFLHEMGHFFLEVFGDAADVLTQRDPSTLTDAQRKVLADYGATLQRFGVESRDAITREHHEQWAREFEGYLFEGKAPSVGLRAAFSRFRAWLVGVYGSLTKLNVKLTPEVRAILDRLLASDQAIAEAEASRGIPALFTTAASAGMSDAEFSLYTKTITDANRTARERLDQQLLAEVRREQTAIWKTQRDAIQAIVTSETQAQPVYQALDAVRGPLKLAKDLIVDRYGKERLKSLPRPYVYTTSEEGVDPNLVAEMFGFSSGDELLAAVAQAPPMKAAIEQETTRRMLAEHGSLLLDGTLGESAHAAVADEDRDAIVRAEMKALRKLQRTVTPHVRLAEREGQGAVRATAAFGDREVSALKAQARGGAATIRGGIPPASVFRDAAQQRIAGATVRTLTPQVFASAARHAGVRAIEQAARQEFDQAIVSKQQQLFNEALAREATRAKDDVTDRAAWVESHNRTAARARLGLAGGSYLDQWDGVLDRYSFAKASPKVLDRLVSMRKWVEGLESQGLPVDLPEALLDDTRHVNYQELTVEQFVGVTDGLKALVHLAQLKNTLLKAVDERDFAVVRDGLVASIREHHDLQTVPLEFRPGDEKWRKVSRWFASHTKLAILARALDGHVDGGPMWEAFIRPINAAADAEEVRKQDAGAAYTAILETAYPGRELGTLNEKRFIPAIQASLSKEGRLAIALNWGNQTSRDRILADPRLKVNAQQVGAILDTLDERDWTFVQSTWDYLNTYWPEIAAKQERLTGLTPEKVEALPVTTKFGELAGGYYPLAYDGRKAARAGQHVAATDAKLATSAAYVRTTTKRGHVEARVQNVTLPLKLDLGVAFAHLDQVIHDLTHHEMLIDTTRLLRDSKVSEALYQTKVLATKGDLLYDQFTSMLQDLALGSSAGAGQPGVLDTAATFLRTRTQIAGMGWNLWTALQQPLGLFNGMSRVGPVWVARGMKRWLRDAATMQHTATWIAEVSPMMRSRVSTATQDLHDLRQQLRQPGGWFDQAVRTVSGDHVTQQTILDGYLWHIGIAQRVADIPTWLGGYEKAMAAGNDEARAIALADQGVLDSQGGGQIKDLAQVQRGSAVAKLFMTFYSYGNTVYNATAERASATDFAKPSEVLTFLGHLSLLTILPALATEGLRCATRTTCQDWPAYLQNVGGQILGDTMNMMVGLRELAGAAKIATGGEAGTRGYEGPAALRPITLVTQLAQQIHQGEADAAFWKATNAAAGILFRYPSAQVQRTVDGFVALEHGTTHNPLALLFGPPKAAK
jgi:hypothetical protein